MVAAFHAVFDIATTTPTTTTLIPTLMGAAVTVAGLATIPYLARVGHTASTAARPASSRATGTRNGEQDT